MTTVPFVGTKKVTVTLKKGTYTFVCDPHASSMKGTVQGRVTPAAPPHRRGRRSVAGAHAVARPTAVA